MERVVGDTGFVVALTNRSDSRHGEVAEVYFQQTEIGYAMFLDRALSKITKLFTILKIRFYIKMVLKFIGKMVICVSRVLLISLNIGNDIDCFQI